jgi:hypothetical protein
MMSVFEDGATLKLSRSREVGGRDRQISKRDARPSAGIAAGGSWLPLIASSLYVPPAQWRVNAMLDQSREGANCGACCRW